MRAGRLIACLQLISTITPVHPVTTWAPLIFIFGVKVTFLVARAAQMVCRSNAGWGPGLAGWLR